MSLRHALVWIAGERMQVKDLAGGTLVHGHPISGRVEVDYPASVQVGAATPMDANCKMDQSEK